MDKLPLLNSICQNGMLPHSITEQPEVVDVTVDHYQDSQELISLKPTVTVHFPLKSDR
jgi:hypothetical protein